MSNVRHVGMDIQKGDAISNVRLRCATNTDLRTALAFDTDAGFVSNPDCVTTPAPSRGR